MKRLVAWVALLGLPCLLNSCSALQGPMRTIQSAFRTLSDAGDAASTPSLPDAPAPSAMALRLSQPQTAGSGVPMPPGRVGSDDGIWDQPASW